MGALDIVINFEQEPVKAGKHLRGKVSITAKEEVSAKELVLTLTGSEITQVEWQDVDNRGGERTYMTRVENGFRSFLSVQVPVESFPVIQNGKIFPGTHVVPFDIELPEHIPSSFWVINGNCDAKIQYDIKVHVRGSGTLWDYKQTKEVQVQGKSLPREPLPFLSEPVEEAINACCCVNKGTIIFGAKVLDTRLDMGETCKIHLSIRNNSTVRFGKIEAKLYQVVYWEGRNRPASKSRDLGVFRFPTLPGAASKGAGERDVEYDQLKNVFKEIEAGNHLGEITMPLDALASYKGSLIKITHHLHIEVEVGKCYSSPEIDVPILCGERPPTDEAGEDSSPSPEGAVVIPSSDVNIGGLPTESDDPDLIFGTQKPKEPSIPTLLEEMEASLTDLQLIEKKLKESAWDGIFKNMSPADLGQVVKKVDMDFDQPRVAELIAKNMDKFSCEHVVAAVKATQNWNRGSMVEILLPHCHDLAASNAIIKKELTEWEQITTQSAFDKALK